MATDTTIKKYASLDTLQTFLDNLKETFPLASETYSMVDHEWNQIADITITEAVNSISGINVSGYNNLMIAVSCVNGTNATTKSGSVIFTDLYGTSYQFPVWTNLFTTTAQTTAGLALFKITGEWIICPAASRHIKASNFLTSTEGGTADNLALVGSGALKCTSPVSTLAVSSLDQNANYFLQSGSRVIIWGWRA